MAPPPKPGQRTSTPLKILMLHDLPTNIPPPQAGYTQSGPLFRAKTRALEKALTKSLPTHSITFTYPTGPIHLSTSDIPGYDTTNNDSSEHQEPEPSYGWWRRKDLPSPQNNAETEIIYTGLQDGLDTIAQTIEDEGPFDGVIGFSQGACAAAMVASLLEPHRSDSFFAVTSSEKSSLEVYPDSFISTDPHDEGGAIQPPLKFAIIYSGFLAPGPRYSAFYNPPLKTRTLHFLGAVDSVVEEGRSRALVDVCEGAS
ncbi:MAG: hypothetical protein Q9218_008324, partial [Villophora microphyllina]